MRGDGTSEPFEVIAAFENRNDAAPRMSLGDLHQLLCCPGKILLDKIETAERIETMRVEPCGDDDQIRAKQFYARQQHGFHRLPEHRAIVARGERRIDDIVMLAALV